MTTWSATPEFKARFSLGDLASRFGAYHALFLICLVQFSTAWYWASLDLSEKNLEGGAPFSVPFRYLTWAAIAGCTVVYLYTRSGRTLAQVLAPFAAFLLIGFLATPLGDSIVDSVRALLFWFLMAFGAATCGLMLSPRQSLKILFWTLFVMLAGSLVVSVLFPDWGTHLYGFDNVWRGLFQRKNSLGIAAMWALVIAYFALPTLGPVKAGILFLLSAICLVMSGSAGSLAVSLGALGYFALLATLIRARLSTALGSSLLIGTVLALVVATLYLWEPVTTALGRDPTLTGRTVIWSMYLQEVQGHWLIGRGPGAFSPGSAISNRLFDLLLPFGAIRQPHSSYIIAIGEGGYLGLAAYVGALFYIAFVAPFRMRTPESLAAALAAFLVMMGGLIEGRGVYSTSFEAFLLIYFRALAVRSVLPDYPYGRRTL